MEISVVLCTHNPRMDALLRVLSSLEAQTLPQSEWELLVIDNASNAPLTARLSLAWHRSAKVLVEQKLGLASARIRGITESHGEVLVFVDDDNVLYPDYLAESLRIAAEWPQLGVWGGSILPEYEVALPSQLKPYVSCLALREITKPRWSNVWSCQEAEPRGAGLCLRRSAAIPYCRFHASSRLRLDDRTGGALSSGGDTEISYVACALGFGMGVFPQLKLFHLIPKERIHESYIVKLSQGLEMSSMLLFYRWGSVIPSSPFNLWGILRLVRHFVFGRGIRRSLALGRIRAAIAARKLIAESGEPAGSAPSFLRQGVKGQP